MRLEALLVLGLLSGLVVAPAFAELKTTPAAIACLAPGDLATAEGASRNHDRTKMVMISCFPVQSDTVARRIEEKAGLWHVILDPNGSDPMEAWARPSSFRE